MSKSKGDFRRRNPVTREMIERHRNTVHNDKRRRVLDKASLAEQANPDEYVDSIDEAGNVNIHHVGGEHE